MKRLLSALLPLLLLAGCTRDHFISDSAVRCTVRDDYRQRRQAYGGALKRFLELPEGLSTPEREAMAFLYAYMPLADVTDHPAGFYLDQVRASFRAREELGWDVPERLFRHYVLPVRINNENLDSARTVFYRELKPRVEGLSMKDAIQEVNHWCLEKATYKGSDNRTLGPLSTVRCAIGRCGEESTLAVAALRSVGIPARQVYTPFWAHTESNHAWVEAWADGEWWFFGACEPTPELNLGWFAGVASRAVFLHTKVFGRYDGPEEVVLQTPGYAEINLTQRYARTGEARVRVVGRDGRPVQGARVDFCIYNGGAFNPSITEYTGRDGRVSLTAGLGDVLVWASRDGLFGYRKLSVGKDPEIEIALGRSFTKPFSSELMTIAPPAFHYTEPEVPEEVTDRCDARIAVDDSIRFAYMATFPSRAEAEAFAAAEHMPPVMADMLEAAAGNAATIRHFVQTAPDKKRALDVLLGLSRKDFCDVTGDVLEDSYAAPGPVLGPRIENEFLTPYKGWLLRNVPASLQAEFLGGGDPGQAAAAILRWVDENIRLDTDPQQWNIPVSPRGVWEAKVAGPRSRNLFSAALAYTFGIRLRRNAQTGLMQYETGPRQWKNIGGDIPMGSIMLTFTPEGGVLRPEYGHHYSLSRIEDGHLSAMLVLKPGDALGSGFSGVSGPLPEGDYLLTSGNRLSNDATPVTLTLLHITAGETLRIPIRIQSSPEALSVLGKFDATTRYLPVREGKVCDSEMIIGELGPVPYVTAVLDVGSEPANHVLCDFSKARVALESWGCPILLVTADAERMGRLQREVAAGRYGPLPSTVVYGIDDDGTVFSGITEGLQLRRGERPVVFLCDERNHVLFVSQGYAIGLGDRIAEKIARLNGPGE